jgi:hypothetical protein
MILSIEQAGNPVAAALNNPNILGLIYFCIGMAPIGALAAAVFGIFTLKVGAIMLVLPAFLAAILLAWIDPTFGKIALRGFLIGVIAVTVYDGVRFVFIYAGLWGDFIPKIGGWLLGRPEPNWILGYLYRYIGDGGGMGMAFVILYSLRSTPMDNRKTVLLSTGWGIFVWICLLATLIFAPTGQEMLFPLTPTTLALSLLGHLVYGSVIGGVIVASSKHWWLAGLSIPAVGRQRQDRPELP